MRVTFIYTELPSYLRWKGAFHFGVASLSAVLKEAGHHTSLVHVMRRLPEGEFLALLDRCLPSDLLAFTSTTNEFAYVQQLAGWAKKHTNLPMVCGGVHATIAPEEVAAAEIFDFVCVGEGEYPLRELCGDMETGADYSSTPSLWIRGDGGWVKNPTRPAIENLDELPFADREVFAYETMEDMEERALVVMASRGCPYNCSYCCNHLIRQRYPNRARYFRFRSVKHVIGEIEQGLARYPQIEIVHFHDDILTVHQDWFTEFAQEYPRRIGLLFRCNSRANLTDSEVARALRAAGCIEVSMGIESGNDQIRRSVLNRKMTRGEIVGAFTACREAGMRTLAFNMVGLPGEDMHAMLDTIKLNAEARPSQIQTSIFYPYPHSALHQLCVERGYLVWGKVVDSYFDDTILELDTLSRDQILFARALFGSLVMLYRAAGLLPGPLGRLAWKLLDRALSSRLLPYRALTRLAPLLAWRRLVRDAMPGLYAVLRPYYKRLWYRRARLTKNRSAHPIAR